MSSDKKLYGTLTAIGLAMVVSSFGAGYYYTNKADQLAKNNQNLQVLIGANKELAWQRGENIDVQKVEGLRKTISEQRQIPGVLEQQAQYENYHVYGGLGLVAGFLASSVVVLLTGPGLLNDYSSRRRKEEQQKLVKS